MKTSTGNVEVETSIAGDEIKLAIDRDDPEIMNHIVAIMTDQYSDTVLATVREYSANAWDSHVAAGKSDRPIMVTLPTTMDPNFIVKDEGVGLSRDDLTNIYVMYGSSTKRDTNSQVGAFGIGCKAALSYADSFTLRCRKNGTEVCAIIARTPEGGASMRIVSEDATLAENGVQVTVPVSHHDAGKFTEHAADFFAYWERGQVLVDGVEPESRMDSPEALRINDDLMLVPNGERGVTFHRSPPPLKGRLVMGNVAYPIEDGRVTSEFVNATRHEVLLKAPIGAVDIAPSREALRYSPKTIAYLEKVGSRIDESMKDSIQARIAAATSKADAVAEFVAAMDVVNNKAGQGWAAAFSWKGAVIPTSIDLPVDGPYAAITKKGDLRRHRYSQAATEIKDAVNKTIAVTEFPNATLGTDMRRKIVHYMKEGPAKDSPVGRYMCGEAFEAYDSRGVAIHTTKGKWSNAWFPAANVVKWDDVLEWARKNSTTAAPTSTGFSNMGKMLVTTLETAIRYSISGDTLEYHHSEYVDDLDDLSDALVVRFDSALPRSRYQDAAERARRAKCLLALRHLTSKERLVAIHVPANRVAKFDKQNSYPDAYAECAKLAKRAWAKLSRNERRRLRLVAIPTQAATLAEKRSAVVDTELRKNLAAVATPRPEGGDHIMLWAKPRRTEVAYTFEKYPLLVATSADYLDPDHLVAYVNAIHATQKGS